MSSRFWRERMGSPSPLCPLPQYNMRYEIWETQENSNTPRCGGRRIMPMHREIRLQCIGKYHSNAVGIQFQCIGTNYSNALGRIASMYLWEILCLSIESFMWISTPKEFDVLFQCIENTTSMHWEIPFQCFGKYYIMHRGILFHVLGIIIPMRWGVLSQCIFEKHVAKPLRTSILNELRSVIPMHWELLI